MKNKNKLKRVFCSMMFLTLLGTVSVNAQMRVGGSTAPHEDAILDLNPDEGNNSTQGLLLPRVRLVSTTDSSPLDGHVKG
ncbi:MAG: hypothetical protein LBR55_03150, partial [Bacteroidales bacterium]|nr:hypothetical protein [Bacteroidales bacterium]